MPTLEKKSKESYLMLVTSVNVSIFTTESVSQFQKSYYDGIAVPFLNAYDTANIPSAEMMSAKIAEWKKITNKDIWPWVYLNRMMGLDPAKKDSSEKSAYFSRIQGADLEDKEGTRSDFLKYWKNALQAAKAAESPGIVVDLEYYNFHGGYDIGALAREMKKSPLETAGLLRQLGGQMADIISQEYPNATIWFLFTDLGNPAWKNVDGQPFYASPAYVVLGLLERSQSTHVPLKVVSGGEVSLGYCHSSLEQLAMKIRNRAKAYLPNLQKYSGILELSGTLTLWSDPGGKSGWLKQQCAPSDAEIVEELQPYLELLLKSYRYNWIYASGAGGYLAFQPGSQRFDSMIGKARTRAHSVSLQ